MRQAVAALLALAAAASACSNGKATAPTVAPTTSTPSVTTPSETVAPTASAPTPTEPAATDVPTTTIDEAAILADVEAAYLDAHRISLEAIRDPLNPDNEARIRGRYVGASLEFALENLRRTIGGNFVARENSENPSFAVIVVPAAFIDPADRTVAVVETCEFNSDKLYERGTAPDGSDALYRDDPVSIILSVQFELIDGVWKSSTGSTGEEVRNEVEQCSNAQ